MKSNHKHKVNETRVRSLCKTITARIIEVIVDTLLIGTIYLLLNVSHAYELAGGISLTVEFLCAVTGYFNDRIWNKINWGREVEDLEEETDTIEHL